ncbi:LytR/AlgR family response regulator transcription factor [Clostridium fungisolvens]|uniref:Stage 0 sporulation protein A homolog n=1 Tax=Clostridium fungisolvens TaxID=1604897 RepID=A0A6V8SMY1_9CLOT|nr:response regulator transcription factor [Clostridium fungisolvens]GFP76528.1 hypothetical protein bsdtw1_02631 [Clostridium fungisolvens]
MTLYLAAICEDQQESLNYINMELSKAFINKNFPIHFDCYTKAQDLLYATCTVKNYHILFLDIDMPGMDGIELCRKIRKNNSNVMVIFITNKEELVFQTFEVRPFRFIRKAHFSEELPALVSDIIREFQEQKGFMITIRELHSDKIYSFNIKEIIYIEVILKHCRIVTTSKEVNIQYKIMDFEKHLREHGFLRPHRSFLVNYRYIFSIQKDSLILDNKASIPLSRNRVSAIKEEFISLIDEGVI